MLAVWSEAVAEAQHAPERPEVATARSRYERGEELYAQANYALALTEFREAYNLMRSIGHENAPLILLSVARCHRELGQNREAIAAYRQVLIEAPTDSGGIRSDAQTELRDLEARQALRDGGAISPIG